VLERRIKTQKTKSGQKKLLKAWENFVLNNKSKGMHDIPVLADWEECRKLKANPLEFDYKHILSKQELDDRIIRRAEFIEVSRPHLDIIEQTLRTQTSTYAIVLADEDGYCIDLRCENRCAGSGEEMYTRLGARCTESDVGNSGIGTALRTRRPVVVEGREHYNRQYHIWTDVGAPISDPCQQLTGVLSIAVINEYASPYTLSMAVATAKAIEAELVGRAYREKIREKNNALSILEQKYKFVLNSLRRGALVANIDSIVNYCNNSAAEIMRTKPENVVGKHLKEIFQLPEHNRVISNTLLKGTGVKNYRVTTGCLGNDIEIVIDTDLVFDDEKNIIGVVAIFDSLTDLKAGRINDDSDKVKGLEVETKEGLKLLVKWNNLRHELKMEKKVFAREVLQIHPNQYYAYENGSKIPTLPNILKLAGLTQKSVEDIYSLL
jgi:PAS domain-containing protein/DNA-binding XRE family transcriptional regulator